ncbi:MAG: hypothetical protein JW729_11125, partial [Bacteroidales bacterium]|nr:hypothetical protein [Bacteroidales bacterium]
MKHQMTSRNYFLFFLILLLLPYKYSFSQNHQDRFSSIDVLHYRFEIQLNDTSDIVFGKATINIEFKKALNTFVLDLKTVDDNGTGMHISSILENDIPIDFEHAHDQIILTIAQTKINETRNYQIVYQGIPDDGLIISKNKFGDRVFFADNWPNRAHHWIPTVDHPSDKASLEFYVNAPAQYQVVSNGWNPEISNLGEYTTTHWKTDIQLPTKLMVIGVAQFAKQNLINEETSTAVSSWVYPQNKEAGFLDYKIALKPLAFYSKQIAPFPYEKLANVQSSTKYGGMENAGCIFYAEKSVTGENKQENLIAHEIAHQWFGDAVSEGNWHHIWLSEGFATYFTGLYIENEHGNKAFIDWLQNQK